MPDSNREHRNPGALFLWMPTALFYLLIVLLICNVCTSFYHWGSSYPDARAYFEAAKRLRDGLPLYESYTTGGVPEKLFLYPPTCAALFIPLVSLPPLLGYGIWMGIHLAILIFLGTRLMDTSCEGRIEQRLTPIVIAGIVLCGFIISEIREGQINLLVVAGLFIVVHTLKKDRITCSAITLAILVHLKMQAAFLLILFLLQRRYSVVTQTVLFSVLLLFVPMAFVPEPGSTSFFELYQSYFKTVLLPVLQTGEIAGRAEYFMQNNSIAAVIHRLFGSSPLFPFGELSTRTGPLLFSLPEAMLTLLVNIVRGFFLLVVLFLARKRSEQQLLLQIAVVFIAVQLTSPSCWEHHLVSLTLMLAPLLSAVKREEISAKFLAVSLAPLVFLYSTPFLLSHSPFVFKLLQLSRLYGAPTAGVSVLLAGGIFLLARRHGDTELSKK
jgi:hypothetical protein